MSYRLNDIPITDYGAVPIARSGYLALTGIFDLPKRKGNTEHSWGTSIEPYLKECDIDIDGRALTLSVGIRDHNLQSLTKKVAAFTNACKECRSIATAFDTFNVYCTGQVEVQEFGHFAIITTRFWQEDIEWKEIKDVTPSYGNGYVMDGYNLARDFGIHIANKQSFDSIAKRIDIPTTEFYRQTRWREQTTVRLHCSMIGRDVADLYRKMRQFHKLIYRSGIRILQWSTGGDGGIHSVAHVYCTRGFTVQIPAQTMLRFSIPLVVEEIFNNNLNYLRVTAPDRSLRYTENREVRFTNS